MPAKFDKDFKRNAVDLVLEKKISLNRASKDLGVGLSTLQRWVREIKTDGESAFPGKGHLKPEDERLRKLERENEVLRRERDILKKALAIFSLP
jgi:transposase